MNSEFRKIALGTLFGMEISTEKREFNAVGFNKRMRNRYIRLSSANGRYYGDYSSMNGALDSMYNYENDRSVAEVVTKLGDCNQFLSISTETIQRDDSGNKLASPRYKARCCILDKNNRKRYTEYEGNNKCIAEASALAMAVPVILPDKYNKNLAVIKQIAEEIAKDQEDGDK